MGSWSENTSKKSQFAYYIDFQWGKYLSVQNYELFLNKSLQGWEERFTFARAKR